MRLRHNWSKNERRGAHAVEFAFVVLIFLLVLFGILEYGRFVFMRNLVVSAAREGARYAVVNTTDTTVVTDTQAFVKQKMTGMEAKVTGYACQVYLADANGNNIGAAGNAQFGQYVAVQIDCTYQPVLPSFLFLNKNIPISTKSMMISEAN